MLNSSHNMNSTFLWTWIQHFGNLNSTFHLKSYKLRETWTHSNRRGCKRDPSSNLKWVPLFFLGISHREISNTIHRICMKSSWKLVSKKFGKVSWNIDFGNLDENEKKSSTSRPVLNSSWSKCWIQVEIYCWIQVI